MAAPSGGQLCRAEQRRCAGNLHQLVRDCEAQGVIIATGDDWFPAEPTGRYLRLNYSGPNPSAFPDATMPMTSRSTAGVSGPRSTRSPTKTA